VEEHAASRNNNNQEDFTKTLARDVGELVQTNYLPSVDRSRRTLIKINGNFNKIYPGSNTSPWFLDALLATLRDNGFRDLAVVEGDLMSFRACQMIKSTGLIKILDRYGVEFINYNKRKTLFSGEWMDYYEGFQHILGI